MDHTESWSFSIGKSPTIMNSIIKPKRPTISGWDQGPKPPAWVSLGYEAEIWRHAETKLCVISAVEVAKDDDSIDRGPEYHISISKDGRKRCSSYEARQVLKQFGMDGAEEDNHVPSGVVRNFWRPVAENLVGLECACKEEEPAIVEDKGDYVWRGVTK